MGLISVVLPTYQRAGVLGRAIASVLAQSHAELELIVVDDGSTDGTPAVVAGINDPRLRFIRSPCNRGGNWARNRGVERATGDIVAFLDSDDVFLPDKLAYVADFFTRRPDIDALLDSFHTRRPEPGRRDIPRINPTLEDREAFRLALFEQRLFKATSAISVRRAALIEAGMFDETLFRRQDMDVLLRLSRRHRCASVSEVLWIKHHTPGAISARRDNFLEAAMAICARHPEYLARPAYRRGLERDLRRHFWQVLRQGELSQFGRDRTRYAAWRPGGLSLWRLLLGGGAG